VTLEEGAPWAAERRSKLTLVGPGLDERHLRKLLDGCLLDDGEYAEYERRHGFTDYEARHGFTEVN